MNEKQLAEILKYSSPTALYIVTWNNLLKLLFCPFKVLVKQNIGHLKEGEEVVVEAVKVTSNLTTVFIVGGRAYFYYHFEILDD
ncbi:hypothetical protein JRG66_05535 [Salinimicrobium tongyeongense]|uniref:Uncharacterized protein n=1 Tax=Salinimicrobium tongyeongense TaxID=2809707 RepID=A0ABY6NUT7_9FLAO|nr:hypothetical protein [Salinimicrobium tongyeongense]UZH56326.1 hypothetical protein JRG66_05535 [Salinimicrobium tongyeongense]